MSLTDICVCGAPVSMLPKDHVCDVLKNAETPASEIGRLVSRILALAPSAGLHVAVKISPARGEK